MLQFIMSMLLFFLIFLFLNYAVLYGVSTVFNLPRTNTLYIIILIAALSYPISSSLETFFFKPSIENIVFYFSSMVWNIHIYNDFIGVICNIYPINKSFNKNTYSNYRRIINNYGSFSKHICDN